MTQTSTGRIPNLLRWLGLTLVVLMGLQLAALLFSWNWELEPFRQLFLDRLVGEAPMALVGLLLMLIAQRLEGPQGRTPLQWLAGVLAILLAIAMAVAVPLSIQAEGALLNQAQQQDAAIAQQATQLDLQRQQVENPAFVDQLIAEAEREGRIPASASKAEKQQKAKEFIDAQIRPQLEQAEKQLAQALLGRDLAVQQRRFGGTGRAIVLTVAFALVALVALV
ncbi:MAG: HpsJ family protein [Cyanobium sp. M30B3]|nr:MAG: HpsJ family protein [Cyanobium sp. M30B3]